MTRSVLTPQEVSREGTVPVYGNADANGSAWNNSTRRNFLHIINGGGVETIVTVSADKQIFVDGRLLPTLTITIPAGSNKLIGPFPAELYEDTLVSPALSSAVTVDFSETSGVTVALLYVPKAEEDDSNVIVPPIAAPGAGDILVTDTFVGVSGNLSAHTPDYVHPYLENSVWTTVGALAEFQLYNNVAAASTGANSTDHANIIELGTPEVEGEASVKTHLSAVGYYGGFILRYVDSLNYLMVVLESVDNLLLRKVVNGVGTTVFTFPFTWTRGNAFRVSFRTIGTLIQFGVNTDNNADYWISAFCPDHLTATKFGIWGEKRTDADQSTQIENLQFRASSTFSPAAPRVWLKADYGVYKKDGVACANNDAVYFIADKSGNRSGAVQSNNNFLPTFLSNANGKPAWYCTDSPKDFLRGRFNVDVVNGGITLFQVYCPQSMAAWPSAHADPSRVHKYDTADGDRLMLAHYPDNSRLDFLYFAQGAQRYNVESLITDDNAWHVISWSVNFATGEHIIRADKATLDTKTGQLAFSSGALAYSISYEDYPAPAYHNEFRLYDYAMNASQMLTIENEMLP